MGYLEEEAVRTYTHAIHDLDQGHIPEWSALPAPKIAVDYWKLPVRREPASALRCQLKYSRAARALAV